MDLRSKRIALIAHCLINQNTIVYGLARYPSMVKELIDILHKYNIGIIQLPCPETLYIGLRRFWHVKEQYDTHNFREFVRNLVKPIFNYLKEYLRNNYDVVALIGISGSPSCGIFTTTSSLTWLGDPSKVNKPRKIRSSGVFMEELLNLLEGLGLDNMLLLEFNYDNPKESLTTIESKLRKRLKFSKG